MTKQKKQILIILLLLVLLIGLGVGYMVLSKKNSDKKAADDAQAQAQAQATTIPVLQLDSGNITSLSIKGASIDNKLDKKDTTWVFEGKENIPVNQEEVAAMLSGISTLVATSNLTDASQDMNEYGLASPAITVTAALNDGSSHTLKIGSKLPVGEGYYAQNDDNKTVYVVAESLFTTFSLTDKQLIQNEETPKITADYVTHLKIDNKSDRDFEAVYTGDKDTSDSTSYYVWGIVKPFKNKVDADTTKFNNLLSNFTSYSFDECVDYNVTNLAQYGLDNPTSELDVDYYEAKGNSAQSTAEPTTDPTDLTGNDTTQKKVVPEADREYKSFSLLIGNQKDKDSYYVMIKGGKGVYLMAATTVDAMIQVEPFDYASHCIYLKTVNELNEMDVTIGDKTLKITRQESKSTDSAGKETTANTYYINGTKVADEDTFLDVCSANYLLELSGESESAKLSDDKTPVMEIKFYPATGDAWDVKYLPYKDDNFYLVDNNGNQEYVTNKRAIDDLVKRFLDLTK